MSRSGTVQLPYCGTIGVMPSFTSDTNGRNGVSGYAVSVTFGSAMSDPIPGNTSVPSAMRPSTMSTISCACGCAAGLTHTMPLTSG